jgi:integrase
MQKCKPVVKMEGEEQNGTIVNQHEGWAWSIAKMNERVDGKEWIPTINDIRLMLSDIIDLRDRAFIAIAYLTAGRVDEIVKTIATDDISFETYYGVECMLTTLPNLKNRKVKIKKIPTPIGKEGDIANIIRDYVKSLQEGDILFPFSRQMAWKKMRKLCGFTNHWMRHIRLTHMITMYDYNEQQLTKFAGWTDSRPAKTYMHLKVKDLLY